MKPLSLLHNRFVNLPLRTKLVLVFSFSMLMVGFVNVYMHVSINSVVSTIDKVYASNVSLNKLMNSLDDVQNNMYRYLSTKSTAALNDYYLSEQSYSEQITSLNDVPVYNELKITEKNIRNISEEYLKLTAAAVAAKRGRDVEQYRSIYEDASELYGYLDTFINELNNARFKPTRKAIIRFAPRLDTCKHSARLSCSSLFPATCSCSCFFRARSQSRWRNSPGKRSRLERAIST